MQIISISAVRRFFAFGVVGVLVDGTMVIQSAQILWNTDRNENSSPILCTLHDCSMQPLSVLFLYCCLSDSIWNMRPYNFRINAQTLHVIRLHGVL